MNHNARGVVTPHSVAGVAGEAADVDEVGVSTTRQRRYDAFVMTGDMIIRTSQDYQSQLVHCTTTSNHSNNVERSLSPPPPSPHHPHRGSPACKRNLPPHLIETKDSNRQHNQRASRIPVKKSQHPATATQRISRLPTLTKKPVPNGFTSKPESSHYVEAPPSIAPCAVVPEPDRTSSSSSSSEVPAANQRRASDDSLQSAEVLSVAHSRIPTKHSSLKHRRPSSSDTSPEHVEPCATPTTSIEHNHRATHHVTDDDNVPRDNLPPTPPPPPPSPPPQFTETSEPLSMISTESDESTHAATNDARPPPVSSLPAEIKSQVNNNVETTFVDFISPIDVDPVEPDDISLILVESFERVPPAQHSDQLATLDIDESCFTTDVGETTPSINDYNIAKSISQSSINDVTFSPPYFTPVMQTPHETVQSPPDDLLYSTPEYLPLVSVDTRKPPTPLPESSPPLPSSPRNLVSSPLSSPPLPASCSPHLPLYIDISQMPPTATDDIPRRPKSELVPAPPSPQLIKPLPDSPLSGCAALQYGVYTIPRYTEGERLLEIPPDDICSEDEAFIRDNSHLVVDVDQLPPPPAELLDPDYRVPPLLGYDGYYRRCCPNSVATTDDEDDAHSTSETDWFRRSLGGVSTDSDPMAGSANGLRSLRLVELEDTPPTCLSPPVGFGGSSVELSATDVRSTPVLDHSDDPIYSTIGGGDDDDLIVMTTTPTRIPEDKSPLSLDPIEPIYAQVDRSPKRTLNQLSTLPPKPKVTVDSSTMTSDFDIEPFIIPVDEKPEEVKADLAKEDILFIDNDSAVQDLHNSLLNESNFNHSMTRNIDRPSAERLAGRLYRLEGFQKTDVARHLSKRNEFSHLVGQHYLEHFDFSWLPLDRAVRVFLDHITLTGETQERERILQHFSTRYMNCNREQEPPATAAAAPSPARVKGDEDTPPAIAAFMHPTQVFKSDDACHTLACALLLLNSDLHSQQIGRHMNLTEFIQNLDDLNEGENYPKDALKELFLSIKKTPIQDLKVTTLNSAQTGGQPLQATAGLGCGTLPRGSNPFLEVPDPSKTKEFKKGYVMRKCCLDHDGHPTPFGKRSWKTFYITLRDFILYLSKDYRKQTTCDHMSNIIRVNHALASPATDYKKKPHVFRLKTSDWSEYLFQTGDSKECQEWIDTINYVAAIFSAPSLPSAVGSQSKKFQRPLLPSSYTKLNLNLQLREHEKTADSLQNELKQHRAAAPDKGSRSRILHAYLEKESYLQFEFHRFKTYAMIVQREIGQRAALISQQQAQLAPSLVEVAIGEVDEPPASPPASDAALSINYSTTDSQV